MQSVFGTSIEFSMRTFLFKTNGSSAEEQQQTISCNLHLDPVADVSSTEPDDCSCYTEEECSGKIGYIIYGRYFKMPPKAYEGWFCHPMAFGMLQNQIIEVSVLKKTLFAVWKLVLWFLFEMSHFLIFKMFEVSRF